MKLHVGTNILEILNSNTEPSKTIERNCKVKCRSLCPAVIETKPVVGTKQSSLTLNFSAKNPTPGDSKIRTTQGNEVQTKMSIFVFLLPKAYK